MFKANITKDSLRKIVKISCVVQLINALMDYILWVNAGYHVPAWAFATLTSGYSILLLAYDKLSS